jgi:hypothetical protein
VSGARRRSLQIERKGADKLKRLGHRKRDIGERIGKERKRQSGKEIWEEPMSSIVWFTKRWGG